ncbi:MAG TPA: hypothetical protein VHE09_15275 [Rhizomicrobium sp.]|nr:hypothetical protein [Rhizomicrobium sp.]
MKLSIFVGAALVAMGTSAFAAESVKINAMWATSSPEVPDGLQIACVKDAKTLEASRTCPVVRYQGATTWIYGYKDNRESLAVVAYDRDGKVIRNVEHRGISHVAKVSGDPAAQTITITGEEGKTITVPWSEFGA